MWGVEERVKDDTEPNLKDIIVVVKDTKNTQETKIYKSTSSTLTLKKMSDRITHNESTTSTLKNEVKTLKGTIDKLQNIRNHPGQTGRSQRNNICRLLNYSKSSSRKPEYSDNYSLRILLSELFLTFPCWFKYSGGTLRW